MSECARCRLSRCACRSGRTIVTVGGRDMDDAKAAASEYLAHRGWRGTLIGVRRRRTRVGIIGYQAWELRYEVTRDRLD